MSLMTRPSASLAFLCRLKEKLTCPEELALHINQAPFKPYRFPVWLGNREKKQSRYHGIQSWASPLSWFKPGHSYIVTWLISNSTFLHHPAVQTSTSQKKVIILLQPCSTGLFQKLDIVLSRDCHGHNISTFRAKPNYLRVIFHTPGRA